MECCFFFFFNLNGKHLKHFTWKHWFLASLNKLNDWVALGQQAQGGDNWSELSSSHSPLRKSSALQSSQHPPLLIALYSPTFHCYPQPLPWRYLILLYSCYHPASLFVELYHILVQTCSTILSCKCDESLSGIVYGLQQNKVKTRSVQLPNTTQSYLYLPTAASYLSGLHLA